MSEVQTQDFDQEVQDAELEIQEQDLDEAKKASMPDAFM